MSRIGSTMAGVAFIALGVYFLLDRFTDVRLPGMHEWWPVLLVLFGALRLTRGRFASGVMLVLMGSVFLAASVGALGAAHGLVGPLLVVCVGIGLVIRATVGNGPGFWMGGSARHE